MRRTSSAMTVVVFACVALWATPVWALTDSAFAVITGSVQGVIKGEQMANVNLAGSADGIEIFSTGFGLAIGTGTTKVAAAPVTIVKRFDRATAKLLRAAFTGEHLTVDITWFMTDAGGAKRTFVVRLEGALLTSIEANAQFESFRDTTGLETLTLSYSRIMFRDLRDPSTGSSICIDVTLARTC
jgi:type VI secretion system Hcp family effector